VFRVVSSAKTLIVNEKPNSQMNSLFNKPNLLFLIFVRNQNRALLHSKLRRPIYRIKLIKALTTIVKDAYGIHEWLINGNLHREDGPARIWHNGTQEWRINGKLHREDGPAVIYANGGQYWYKNGKWHRDDGPAVIGADGTQQWYKNGNLHREDGPAYIWADGSQEWWINDKKVKPFIKN